MLIEEIQTEIDVLSKRDLIKIYLYINKKFEDMKIKNPKATNNTVYSIRHPEKTKEIMEKYRIQKKQDNVNKRNIEKEKKKEDDLKNTAKNSLIKCIEEMSIKEL